MRLTQGRADAEVVYDDDPVAVARRWEAAGAALIHVVDLDGAFAGRPSQLEVVAAIARAVSVPVQVGGGLRTVADVEAALAAGAARAILGTAAIEAPGVVQEACARFGGQRVLVGIDARDGRVAVRGWVAETTRPAPEVAREMAALGVREIVFTDIARDGMLQGPNWTSLGAMLETGLGVIASGGVASLADVRRLAALAPRGVTGVIIGKALYTGAIDLAEAIAAARQATAGTAGAGE